MKIPSSPVNAYFYPKGLCNPIVIKVFEHLHELSRQFLLSHFAYDHE